MNTERETKTVSLPSGTQVVLKTYLTARENMAIDKVLMQGAKVRTVAGNAVIEDMDISAVQESEKESIKQLVVSVNGSAENNLERILDFSLDDYNALIAEINTVSKKNPTK